MIELKFQASQIAANSVENGISVENKTPNIYNNDWKIAKMIIRENNKYEAKEVTVIRSSFLPKFLNQKTFNQKTVSTLICKKGLFLNVW